MAGAGAGAWCGALRAQLVRGPHDPDTTPLGGVFNDTKWGWLAVGPKLCVFDMKTGQKVSAWTFGATLSIRTEIACVTELPTPLKTNTRQLLVSLQCEDIGGMICVVHCNGSQVLHCIQTEAVITQITTLDGITDGPLSCFDGLVIAGTKHGELFVYDLNRACLVQALIASSQGYDDQIKNEQNMASLAFLSLDDVSVIEEQRDIALETDEHLTVNLNEQSNLDNEYLFRKPDGGVLMRSKRGHVVVTSLLYVPQLASVAVGYNFGAFQIWNLMTMRLEYTSSVNVDCLPITHFGFQEPCDDPKAYCYLWVTYSCRGRFEDDNFPLAVMNSLTYQGKRILNDMECLYVDFISCTPRFEIELTCVDNALADQLVGGRMVSCHTYSVPTNNHSDGDESVLNICQLVWESWSENVNAQVHYSMLLFDLDQWYKDQMPATLRLQNTGFTSCMSCNVACEGNDCLLRDIRLLPSTLAPYTHVQRLEEHFHPNSLQYSCICLTTTDTTLLSTTGVQRQLISAMEETGPTVLLDPGKLYRQCQAAGLTPLYMDYHMTTDPMEQRKYLLTVALEARLTQFLKKCAVDWASGSHSGVGCTLQLFVEWCWGRALLLKSNGRGLTKQLFDHSVLECDRNVVRCLEHCVRQLTQLSSLLDAVVTKCCNLVVPDALSDMEERCKAINMVAVYFQVVQWFLSVGLLPEYTPDQEPHMTDNNDDRLPYPVDTFRSLYQKRRIKLRCLDGQGSADDSAGNKSCSLLYIDQLIEHECGGELIHKIWREGGSECGGVYPPPSLHSLLRVYLLGEVSAEHKHSIVLYLLLDYYSTFQEPRYAEVTHRLKQFPTMFGLSNTAIKATQAFWNLDHRNFDYALDQLQCLTGNALSEWQHRVVLSALLAQKKTQAALQYLHVRKPAPIQSLLKNQQSPEKNIRHNRVNDHDKLEEWQSCCELYLARQLVFEAMDVIRLCVENAATIHEKVDILNIFFEGCKRTGQLSKILKISLLPLEEQVFIKFLMGNEDRQCADILVMYYLQQARYLEAQRYNNSLKQHKLRKDLSTSIESIFEAGMDRDVITDHLVEVACNSLPQITDKVAYSAATPLEHSPRVVVAKPMSVFVQANLPKNQFSYKSTFIQNSIQNASETWVQKPQFMRGMKRALNIDETPFICTPKLARKSYSIFHQSNLSDMSTDATPPKRPKLDLSATPKTPKSQEPNVRLSSRLCREMESLLDMPEVEKVTPWKLDRSEREATPHSILKVRRMLDRDMGSPVDSRYLADTDEELETASVHSHHTNYSEGASKVLRFEIPKSTGTSETSPAAKLLSTNAGRPEERTKLLTMTTDKPILAEGAEREEVDADHRMDSDVCQSPAQRLTTEEKPPRKSYKDNVKGRRSLSMSANSSLNDDPQNSIESIADIPIMVINPRYSGCGSFEKERDNMEIDPRPEKDETSKTSQVFKKETDIFVNSQAERDEFVFRIEERDTYRSEMDIYTDSVEEREEDSLMLFRSSHASTPRMPQARPSIKSKSFVEDYSSRRVLRSRSRTPECFDDRFGSPNLETASPKVQTVTPGAQKSRSRSKTPNSTTKLDPIPEVPQMNEQSKTHTLKTPEKAEQTENTPQVMDVAESPKSPLRRSQRSRSRTPEVESPKSDTSRNLRGRSKTPERDAKIASPKMMSIDKSAKKGKTLSRLVLEANTFSMKVAKTQTVVISTSPNESVLNDSDSIVESTPLKIMKTGKVSMSEYQFSPIVDKSILRDTLPSDSVLASTPESNMSQKTGTFSPMNDTLFEKSILGGYKTSSDHSESNSPVDFPMDRTEKKSESNWSYSVRESILKDASMSVSAGGSSNITDDLDNESASKSKENVSQESAREPLESDQEKQSIEKRKIVEIEREIHEIEGISDNDSNESQENQESDSDQDSDSEGEDIHPDLDTDSGKDTELNDSSDSPEYEESEEERSDSNAVANKALCLDEDSDIVLVDDSEDDKSNSESPKKRTSRSSSSSNDFALQIDLDEEKDEKPASPENIDIYDEKEFIKEDNQNNENPLDTEIQGHMISLDESFTESVKDDTGMLEKEHDPFLKPPSELSNPSDTDLQLKPKKAQFVAEVSTLDVFNDGNYSLLTDDNSALDTDRSEIEVPSPVKVVVTSVEGNHNVEIESMDVVDNVIEPIKQCEDMITQEATTSELKSSNPDEIVAMDTQDIVEKNKCADKNENRQIVDKETNEQIVENEPKDKIIDSPEVEVDNKEKEKYSQVKDNTAESNEKPITRKRTRSIISNASKISEKSPGKLPEEPVKLPETPKRRPSVDSNLSAGKKTPNRGRSKEKDLNESIEITPLRRSTRQRSKQSEDDNISVASNSSFKSKADSESVKSAGSIQKSRKSILLTNKPDLSVIPEMEDTGNSRMEDASHLMQEYSSTRRLTRHQRSMLERSMEPPRSAPRLTRKQSATSSNISLADSEHTLHTDEDNKSEIFPVPEIDPISLLNKTDFDGPPDLEEFPAASENYKDAVDSTKPRRLRATRAASETGTVKEVRKPRRMSVDLEIASNTPELAMSPGSPGRPRRTSFNKAIEALSTPKRARRHSTDVKDGGTDTVSGSPIPQSSKDAEVDTTPARRTRRNSSVHSDSAANSPVRRTRRIPSVVSVDEEPELALKK